MSFFHRCDVVGDHAAEAGGGDVEGLASQSGDEVAGETGAAEDGGRVALSSVGMRWQMTAFVANIFGL